MLQEDSIFPEDNPIFTAEERLAMETALEEVRKSRELLKKITLIAHRGKGPSSLLGAEFSDKIIPENTLRAFKKAIIEGADGFELDIFMSSDGELMVVHDDELWRNVYGMARADQEYSEDEKSTHRVGMKTAAELQGLPMGPNGEKMPKLEEIFDLANEANAIRDEQGLPPLIINIELKDATANRACLKLIEDYIAQYPDSGVNFDSICFCSFHHDCLKELKKISLRHGIKNIQIAPGIKTSQLFGQENVNKDFTVKEGAVYDLDGLEKLKLLVEGNNFTAYDAILWDIYWPLVLIARNGGKQLHASTSDFRQYNDDHTFLEFLYSMSQEVTVYFKCDEVAMARTLLTNIAERRDELRDEQQLRSKYKRSKELSKHLDKPVPYSKILKQLRKMEEFLSNMEEFSGNAERAYTNFSNFTVEDLINQYLINLSNLESSSTVRNELKELMKLFQIIPEGFLHAYTAKANTESTLEELEEIIKTRVMIATEQPELAAKSEVLEKYFYEVMNLELLKIKELEKEISAQSSPKEASLDDTQFIINEFNLDKKTTKSPEILKESKPDDPHAHKHLEE